MASIANYVTSKGFNKNIFLEGREQIDTSKFGMGFFPGNEILNPKQEDEEEDEEEVNSSVNDFPDGIGYNDGSQMPTPNL